MKNWSITKIMVIIGVVFFVSLGVVAIFTHSDKPVNNTVNKNTITDNASGDTTIETIKTLTQNVNTVEAQNKALQSSNAQFQSSQSEALNKLKENVTQQLSDLQTVVNQAQLEASQKQNNTAVDSNTMTWVEDMQTPQPSAQTNGLLQSSTTSATPQAWDNTVVNSAIPYYTLPVNATLTGAVAMQPIIGRIPINGQVPDPYRFKVIIGNKNLAANGVDIPSDIAGIVASGVASGDMLGGCARGRITSMTFVFQDGTISTTESTDNEALGEIAANNGNPCIPGSFHTNAPEFLGGTVLLAGAQGYANALSQAQTMTSTAAGFPSISTIIGNSGTYAAGQAASSASTAAQQWWQQRAQNSFDYVFVPNVDPDTGNFLKLNINLTQSIAIDYNPNGRKISYEHITQKNNNNQLD